LDQWEAQSKIDRSAQSGGVSDLLSGQEQEILGTISERFSNNWIEAVSRARSLGLL
jgi:hypothetical protein